MTSKYITGHDNYDDSPWCPYCDKHVRECTCDTPPPPAGDGGVIVVAQLVAACHDLADKHAARSRVTELRKIRDQGYEVSDDHFMISWIHLESMITALDAWDALSASAQAQATEG